MFMIDILYSFLPIFATAAGTYCMIYVIRLILLHIREKMITSIIKKYNFNESETSSFKVTSFYSSDMLLIYLVLPVLFFCIFGITIYLFRFVNINIESSLMGTVISLYPIVAMMAYIIFVSIIFFSNDYNQLDKTAKTIQIYMSEVNDRKKEDL